MPDYAIIRVRRLRAWPYRIFGLVAKNSSSKHERLSTPLLAGRMSYTQVLLLHSFGSACRSNRRRPTIHYFVRSHVSSDADFKRSPFFAGGWCAGQVLVGSSVEGHLSEYATIPCLGLPVFSATVSDYWWWPTFDLWLYSVNEKLVRDWRKKKAELEALPRGKRSLTILSW